MLDVGVLMLVVGVLTLVVGVLMLVVGVLMLEVGVLVVDTAAVAFIATLVLTIVVVQSNAGGPAPVGRGHGTSGIRRGQHER